jgi:ADP-heptose:LPS heptosyltransferase
VKKSNKKALMAIRLSALGDVAMTIPVLLSLRRKHPDTALLFITKTRFTPILERIPGLKAVPFYDKGIHKGFSGLWRLRRELMKESLVGVADLHAVLRTKILKTLLSGTGLPFKVLDKGRSEKRRLTSWKHKEFSALKSTHERYADVFRQLGYHLSLSPEDILPKEKWPESLRSEWERGVSCRLGIAPFAAHQGKCYPEDEMKQVLELLGEIPGVRIYLFGGGQRETEVLRLWERQYSHCYSVAGTITLSEELAMISNLDLMLSMDSGNGHLAAMYGVPVITVWGVTHPNAGFAPFLQPEENSITADRDRFPLIPTSVYGNKVPPGYDEVMRTIPPRRIYNRILHVLRERGIGVPDSETT